MDPVAGVKGCGEAASKAPTAAVVRGSGRWLEGVGVVADRSAADRW
jgi:hypothetical protein